MHFVGLDLAWGERKPTGVAVVDDEGTLVHVSAQTDDASILAAIEPFVADDCVVGIDAPLIVTNPTGNRPCEAALNRDFRGFEAGAHPSNTGKSEFANGTRGARLAVALDLDLDPRSPRQRRALEVYPHAAAVALFRLGKTLKFKDKRGRKFEKMQSELLRLMTLIEGLQDADVPLRVAHHEDWQRLRRSVETATRKSELRRAEDPVDSVLCAYVALFSVRRPDDVTVYGDVDTGYILTPTLPPGLNPSPVEPVSAVVRTAIADYQARRPALVAATANYCELVTALLDDAGINYLSVTARTKSVESFAAKAERTADGRRLFSDPLVEITDQVGLRIITYLREDVDAVATLLSDEMRLLDDRDMGMETAREGRWGYASRHLLVGIEGEQQPASIQVRTVLQHAWAEFEHDIRYKGAIPAEHVPELDRRFTLAAGLLELADREFTAIRERLLVTMTGEETVEQDEASTDPRIATPVLATYLGNRYADAGWSRTDHYGWISGLLLELGITSLDELTTLLDTVDADAINRAMGYRYPAGAVRRLDDALLAVFGDRYLRLHGNAHRVALLRDRLKRLNSGDG
jgi:predicted RNase H-like nuclease/ppGpp synthetase/RelA/SpoT-type nucleotidyltranferase